MTWHPEALTPEQGRALQTMGRPVSERGFYLGGGTALALQLGHRYSEDFDQFISRSLGEPRALLAELRDAGVPLEGEEMAQGTLHATVMGVKISLMEFRWDSLAPTTTWDETGAAVASLRDLATMKLEAVASRGLRKDFVDIWALVRMEGSLGSLIALYRQRFPTANVGHLLVALAYFDDAEHSPMPKMLWDAEWLDIRRSLEAWVRSLARP